MTRPQRITVIGAAMLACAAIAFVVWGGVLESNVWEREQPLIDALHVTGVSGGAVTLADGRTFLPAGIHWNVGLTPDQIDSVLRATSAQGVTVVRDLGDGRAFLMVEPRFFNWCGTRGHKGNPWARWAGSYFQCPLSEALVIMGYSTAHLDQVGLTQRERWRLEGVVHAGLAASEPVPLSADALSI